MRNSVSFHRNFNVNLLSGQHKTRNFCNMRHIYFYVILVITLITISYGNGNINETYLNLLDLNVNKLLKDVGRSDFSHLSRDSEDDLCANHILQVATDISQSKVWALEMVDAWGKIPSGIFFGNLAVIGHFDECLNVTSPNDTMRGQYCLATIPIDTLMPTNTRVAPTTPDKPQLSLGICVPDSCKTDFLNIAINETWTAIFNTSLEKDILSEAFCSKNVEIKYTVVDWIAIAIFSTVGFLILFSTIYELITNYLQKTAKPIFIMFSAYTNSGKLFAVQKTSGADVMDCLNGIRCLSIVWVVFGHTYMFLSYIPVINSITLFKWIETYYSMFILNATVVVDTFFLMSGLLVSWSVLRQLDRTGKLNIPLMYFHRYLRLTPILAASILFSVSLIRYVGSGPFWNTIGETIVHPCEEYWWSALLYVQNYVNPERMCLGHTWYLSVDTQLYVLSPLILIPMWKWKRKFLWVIPVLILISVSYIFSIVMVNDFSMKMLSINKQESMRMIYYPTHTRMGPWLVGILLGYYLNMNRGRRIKLSKFLVIFGWISCFSVIFAILLGPYQAQQLTSAPTTLTSAFYEALNRTSWSIAVSWIVLACTQGYGGIINSFLSCPLWQPFGRLTYSVYIVHLILQTVIAGHIRTNLNFTDYEVISKFWGDFGVTLSISILMVLAFESPIIALEKILFKKAMQKPTTSSTQQLCTNEDSPSGSTTQKTDV